MAENENKNIKSPQGSTPPKKGRPKFSFYWIYAILAVIFIVIQWLNYSNPIKKEKIETDTSYKDFVKKSYGSSFGKNPQFYYQIGFHPLPECVRAHTGPARRRSAGCACLPGRFPEESVGPWQSVIHRP